MGLIDAVPVVRCKETVIRRIDDLGRVGIPKEFRNSMDIHAGDELELFILGDTIVIRKQ